MALKGEYDLNRLRDYTSLFSRNEACSWVSGEFQSVNAKIKRYDCKWLAMDDATYLDYFKYIYGILRKNYRNEYIYKNEFLNEWLIRELGQSNSSLFSEFRVGNSVADLLMFNGISKVFEIKTELDSDSRLNSQVQDYKKAFNELYLIIPSFKLNSYKGVDEDIGIITYSTGKTSKFELKRKAIKSISVDSFTIMRILHTNEYKKIVESYLGKLPEMTSFNQFDVCSEIIQKMPNNELNTRFIEAMKMRKAQPALKKRSHKEFNQLRLALGFSKEDEALMLENLRTKILV